ncbi:phosphotransferase [Mesoplasma seiffertii]|uniref:phosphotransferase n=1 Tax=Mesoplasma seiffertii TaxID=28224 RepID=UPI00047DB703|nr:phosphotransferase [Mesoplasma seiffertii]
MENKQFQGLTNTLFLKNDLIGKKSNSVVDYFLDRNNEQRFYEQVQHLQLTWLLTPKHWEFDEDGTFTSYTKYHPQAKTFHDVTICVNKMKTVINLIEHFHQLDMDLAVFDPQRLLAKFKTKITPIFDLSQYDAEITRIISNWDDGSPLVVSHNDLVRGNFLKLKRRWVLIDFEFVSLNHWLFDYASFMSESLEVEQWPKFLNLLNLSVDNQQKLQDFITYQNYLWSYWASYMYHFTSQEIFKEIAQDKLKKLAF